MNNTTDTTATDQPPAPNGHGASNGTNGDTPQVAAAPEGTSKDSLPSSKKKKKKGRRDDKTSASAAVESAATAEAVPAAPTVPQPPIEDLAAEPIVEPAAEPVESLRIRMKVWTEHTTGKRYLMPSAFMRDVVDGRPISDVMYAYAMRADDIQRVTLTAGEWQALPFVYVQEDGPAPRTIARPDDVVVSTEGRA